MRNFIINLRVSAKFEFLRRRNKWQLHAVACKSLLVMHVMQASVRQDARMQKRSNNRLWMIHNLVSTCLYWVCHISLNECLIINNRSCKKASSKAIRQVRSIWGSRHCARDDREQVGWTHICLASKYEESLQVQDNCSSLQIYFPVALSYHVVSNKNSA